MEFGEGLCCARGKTKTGYEWEEWECRSPFVFAGNEHDTAGYCLSLPVALISDVHE